MKDFESQKTDMSPDAPAAVVKSKTRERSGGVDAAHASPEADVIHARELSHPANAAPLANVLTQLQHSYGNTYVQRVVAERNQAQSATETQATDHVQTLDAGTRAEMESAFGENFGDVRVHSGPEAESLSDELGARAATRGRDIYFGTNEYKPGTAEGKQLIAHELTHVVQQSASPDKREAGEVSYAGEHFEDEADRIANAVLRDEPIPTISRNATQSFQLQARPGQAPPTVPGGINLTREPHGALSGSVTYAYDAAQHELILQGPTQMTVASIQGGTIVFDSARVTMTTSRQRTVRIRISGPPPLSVTVNGTVFRFIP
jgi:Domain of unknown function (DUF4157)